MNQRKSSNPGWTLGRHRLATLLLTILLALVVGGCGSESETGSTTAATPDDSTESTTLETPDDSGEDASDSPDALEELVAGAQEEGSVTWYHSGPEAETNAAAEVFEEKYGIDVVVFAAGTSDMTSRYVSEMEAGAVTADVMSTAPKDTLWQDGVANGWMVPIEETGILDLLPDYPEEFLRPEFHQAVWMILEWNVMYNSDLVDDSEVPETWKDVTDGRFADTLGLVDPRNSDAHFSIYTQTLDEYGEGWFDDVAEQYTTLFPNASVASQAVAAGEIAAYFPSSAQDYRALVDAGAPVTIVQPTPLAGLEFFFAVSAEAPHPNAARLFGYWLLSEEDADAYDPAPTKRSVYEVDLATYTQPPGADEIAEAEAVFLDALEVEDS